MKSVLIFVINFVSVTKKFVFIIRFFFVGFVHLLYIINNVQILRVKIVTIVSGGCIIVNELNSVSFNGTVVDAVWIYVYLILIELVELKVCVTRINNWSAISLMLFALKSKIAICVV
jgi:hypothetical protein